MKPKKQLTFGVKRVNKRLADWKCVYSFKRLHREFRFVRLENPNSIAFGAMPSHPPHISLTLVSYHCSCVRISLNSASFCHALKIFLSFWGVDVDTIYLPFNCDGWVGQKTHFSHVDFCFLKKTSWNAAIEKKGSIFILSV